MPGTAQTREQTQLAATEVVAAPTASISLGEVTAVDETPAAAAPIESDPEALEIARATQPTLRHYFEIACFRAYADLKSNAVRAYLGTAWWVLEPIAYVGAYYLAFEWIMQRGGGLAIGSLITGILYWKWFASSLTTGANSIASSGGLIRLVRLPKFLLPLSASISTLLKFLFVLPVLLIFLALTGQGVSITWLALPLIVVLSFMLNTAVASLVGAIVPFVRDLRIVIDNLLLLLMFSSGVFFDLRATAGSRASLILEMNPIAAMIELYRSILIHHEWPDPAKLAFVFLSGAVTLALAWSLLRRFDGEYAKVV